MGCFFGQTPQILQLQPRLATHYDAFGIPLLTIFLHGLKLLVPQLAFQRNIFLSQLLVELGRLLQLRTQAFQFELLIVALLSEPLHC